MKVLHVLNELKFSGAEVMYVAAAPIFIANGCELHVLNSSLELGEYAKQFEDVGYKVYHMPLPNSLIKQVRMRDEICNFIKNGNYDVVHVHRAQLAWIFAYCCHKLAVPCVYTYHSVFGYRWQSYIVRFLQRYSQRHFWKLRQTSISDSVYNFERKIFFNPTKLIYNWWNHNKFYPLQSEIEKSEIRKDLGIPIDSMVLISVGSCRALKRHKDVIHAFSEIVKSRPNSFYIHVGDGELNAEEKRLVSSLGLNEKVLFAGNQNDVRKYLVASDIYTMTSTAEGISLTTIEAMACGIPCVLYNVPGLCDFNSVIQTSILIPENYLDLSSNVIALYDNSLLREKLKKNALNYIFQKFSMEKNVKSFLELYNR